MEYEPEFYEKDPAPEQEYRYPSPEEFFRGGAETPPRREPGPRNPDLSVRLARGEVIGGLIFLPFYLFLLALGISLVCMFFGCADLCTINMIYYAVCFVCCGAIFFRFLRDNLRLFLAAPKRSALCAGKFLLINCAADVAFSLFAAGFPEIAVNENNNALLETFNGNPGLLLLVALFLAPVVEECLFRGLVFSSLRSRSRFLAYAVSILVFSAIHIVPYLTELSPATFCFNLLQYGVASWLLCRCYEKADCLFSSVLLHSFINLIACSLLLAGF